MLIEAKPNSAQISFTIRGSSEHGEMRFDFVNHSSGLRPHLLFYQRTIQLTLPHACPTISNSNMIHTENQWMNSWSVMEAAVSGSFATSLSISLLSCSSSSVGNLSFSLSSDSSCSRCPSKSSSPASPAFSSESITAAGEFGSAATRLLQPLSKGYNCESRAVPPLISLSGSFSVTPLSKRCFGEKEARSNAR